MTKCLLCLYDRKDKLKFLKSKLFLKRTFSELSILRNSAFHFIFLIRRRFKTLVAEENPRIFLFYQSKKIFVVSSPNIQLKMSAIVNEWSTHLKSYPCNCCITSGAILRKKWKFDQYKKQVVNSNQEIKIRNEQINDQWINLKN